MNAEIAAVDANPEGDPITLNASQHGARGKDKLLRDLKAVVDDAQSLMKEAVDTSAENIAGVPAYLEDRLSTVKDNLHRVKNALETKVRYATAASGEYVRENPWKSAGFATAASLLFGFLLFRARAPGSGRTRKDEK